VVPWALAFAPDSRLFVTERPGRVRVIQEGALLPDPAISIAEVAATGEGGLLGLALAPDFPTTHHVFVYYTYRSERGLRNRVVRYVEQDNTLLETARVILDDIPAGSIHDGGLLAFGPDAKLYVTTGDASQADLAQNRDSLAGKILRINPDGTVPADNPFPGSPVYSFGHRNPQGLAWQPQTRQLYATEHGPTGNDEVNLIEAGQNYGWPTAQGPQHPAPFRAPLAAYSPSVAPAGATFYTADLIPQWRGSFLFGTLRGTHLHRIAFDATDPRRVAAQEGLYEDTFGRLRAVVQGPDGAVYVTTSNRDGRGSPQAGDDRILRIAPAAGG
ncbi:MAG: PQQ-dependent sugar dehydrogenase, partial [Chloroflexota bacterium]|nr:PQQ-dependent sugar dehydrogenase [Chloroflexota bacterium]